MLFHTEAPGAEPGYWHGNRRWSRWPQLTLLLVAGCAATIAAAEQGPPGEPAQQAEVQPISAQLQQAAPGDIGIAGPALQSCQQRVMELEQAAGQGRAALSMARAETAEAAVLLEEHTRRLQGLERDTNALRAERDAALQGLQRAERATSDLGGERDDLRARLAETQLAAQGLTLERDDLVSRLGEAMQSADTIRQIRDELELRLTQQRGELRRLGGALEAAQLARERLQAELDLANASAAALRSAQQAGEADLRGLRGEVDRLNAARQELETGLAQSQQALQESRLETQRLGDGWASLRDGLPAAFGGEASLARLKDAAMQTGLTLRQLYPQLRRAPRDAQLREAQHVAAKRLRDQQLLVAAAMEATGVYRLRPDDTLGGVAARFYGEAAAWPRIHAANGYILDDPDRLIPGLTLVLP